MGDSPITNTIKNVAGYGVGTLAALDTIKGGGLGSYLMNRQRLMADPGFRSTLAGSPFAAGVFGVSGATGPAPAAPTYPAAATGGVAQPGDMIGAPAGDQVAPPGAAAFAPLPTPTAQNVPGYIPGTPRAWMPNLPPYDPEEGIKQQALASQQIAAGSPNPLQAGIAKMQMGIMPTGMETNAVIQQGKQIQRDAGLGSTVGVKLPGMTVQIGSPYNIAPLGEEEFATPEQARAAAAAHGPGWSIGPTVHGGWRPIPPPTNEQMMPPAPGTGAPLPGGATGPVLQGGGAVRGGPTASVTIPNRTNNPGNIKDGAFAAAQPGYIGPGPAATDGGRFAVFDSPAAGGAAMTNLLGAPSYQGLTVNQAANRWSNGGYGGEVGAAAGIHPDRPMSSLSDAERAQLASSMARREGFTGALPSAPPPPAPPPPPPPAPAERGTAYAAEPPAGAKVMPTPAPAPVPTFDPGETVPHVVVPMGGGGVIGYPPAAPMAPGTIRATPYPVIRAPVVPAAAPAPGSPEAIAAGPPPMPPAGIYVDPSTKEPLKTISQTYQGGRTETYGAPDLGDFNTQLKARKAGIVDPRTASTESVANALAQDRALAVQTKLDDATIARTKRAMTEGESKEFKRLDALKTNLNNFLTTYGDPATRDQFVGWAGAPLADLQSKLHWTDAAAIDKFRTAVAPLTVENFADEKGKALPGMEDLAPVAPSIRDTPSQFNEHLQAFQDALDLKIFQDHLIRATPVDELTPGFVSAARDAYLRDRAAMRMAAIQPDVPPAAAPAAPPPDATPPPAAPAPEAPPPAAPWTPTWVH